MKYDAECERLGGLYQEIVGYNPFYDNPSIEVDQVVYMMKEYDKETGKFEFSKAGAY